jgi:hypothetical protein
MVDLKYTPIPLGKGGGSLLLNALQSNSIGGSALSPRMGFYLPYKLKIDGSGYWDDLRTVALEGDGSQIIDLSATFPHRAFPTNVWVRRVYTHLITAFSGGTVSAATLSLGDTGNDDEWADLVDVFTGAGTVRVFDTADADAVFAAAQDPVAESAYVPLATLATTGDNVNDLTAGELDIVYEIYPLLAALPGR